MMDNLIKHILDEINISLGQVTQRSIIQASNVIKDASRIFVVGAGRSGLCIRAVAMRLMQTGKTVYVVGETITPSIQSGDLLILASGSGQTSTLMAVARKAQEVGAKILLFTASTTSPLASIADYFVEIPAPSLRSPTDVNGFESIQPMGTLFEQSLLIVCDSIVLRSMDDVGFNQMQARHANLE
jgi:6-phospho-3-hexuloisomerase